MNDKESLSLAVMDEIMSSALGFAADNHWAVSVAICDEAGFLLAFKRLPKAPLFSAKLAIEKARTSAISMRDTKVFEDMVNGGKISILSASEVICIEGGVVMLKNGQMIGGLGVSGAKSSEDGEIARHALEVLAPD